MIFLEEEKKISQATIDRINQLSAENLELLFVNLGIDVSNVDFTAGEFRMRCPFHNGTNDTSFWCNERGNWKCFSMGCHDGFYGPIGLVMKAKGLSFPKAAKYLMDLFNVDNIKDDPATLDIYKSLKEMRLQKKNHSKKEDNNGKFTPFPVDRIKGKIEPAKFFLDQGFNREILIKYMVGECHDPKKVMFNRAFATILNSEATHVIGVSGRTLYPECKLCGCYHDPLSFGCPTENSKVKRYPKWMHFNVNTSVVLYNEWFAKEFIKNTGVAIVCEGPKEIWALESWNIHTGICVLGCRLYEEHIKKLVSYGARKVILALDNDIAGCEASERIMNRVKNYFDVIDLHSENFYSDDLDDSTIEQRSNLKKYIEGLYL